jgi:hypothetical protein
MTSSSDRGQTARLHMAAARRVLYCACPGDEVAATAAVSVFLTDVGYMRAIDDGTGPRSGHRSSRAS